MRTLIRLTPFLLLLSFLYSCRPSAEEYITLGKNKLKEQKLEEAISFFDEALKIDPTIHDAWNAKGVAAYQLDKNTDALNAFNKAIELNQEDYRYFYNRGNVQRKINAPQKAAEDYTKAISLDASHYEIFLNRALSLSTTKQLKEAIADFNKAAELNQLKDPAILLYRGKVFLRLFEFEKASLDFQQLTQIDKKNPDAWYQLGLSYQGLKDLDNACPAIVKAKEFGHPQANAFLAFYCK